MVSFQCEGCNDVVTKKKLDAHVNRCYSDVTCIDCMMTFHDYSYRQHTSCMSEAQKTQGSLYREKKKGGQNGANQSAPRTPVANMDTTIAKIDVPPPAPSPPQLAEPVNVFDFLVHEKSPTTTASSKPSPRKLKANDSPQSLQASANQTPHADHGFTYGAGPVAKSLERFDSDFNLAVESQFGPLLDESKQTPGPLTRIVEPPSSKNEKSEKKRKRAIVEELDLSAAKNDKSLMRRSLHTGLTGGLSKLLANAEDRNDEASPSSPKKRTKHTKSHKRDDSSDDEKHRRRREKNKHRRSESNGELQLVKTDDAAKAVDFHDRGRQMVRSGAMQKLEQGHSDFFLSLVDKGPKSSKGQSIWGALKMFHEGQRDDHLGSQEELVAFHQNAERALFRGLRMKLNRDGEIVLFARADKEHSVAPEQD